MKVLFLDVDGVLNCEETFKSSNRFRGVIGLDPYMGLLVNRIIEATGCVVVLSSSWRGSKEGEEEVERQISSKLYDRTGRCCTGIRGVEIYQWIVKNVAWAHRPENGGDFRYAILDDDMLLWQKDHFFQTSSKTGLTDEIAEAVKTHLLT